MKFLTEEERLDLNTLLETQSDGVRALFKCFDYCVNRREQEVVKYVLTPERLSEFGFLKAKAEGARLLVTDLKQLLDKNSKSE